MQIIRENMSFPLFTMMLNLLVLLASAVYFYLLNSPYPQDELLRLLGCPGAFHIFNGEWWGIVINSFVHIHPLMLAFNIAGLWILGAFIERRSGWKKLLVLGLIASILSSLTQLVISDDPGIGMSGVNYFLLGYIYVRSIRDERYHFNLRYVALALGSFGLLLIAIGNFRFDLNIGYESIISGLVYGFIFDLIKSKSVQITSFVISALSAVVLLVYCPWSAMWQFTVAFKHHSKGELSLAEKHYVNAIQINPSLKDARLNLNLIRIDRLSKEAYSLHASGKYVEAGDKYQEILKIEPDHKWAKDQIKLLP